MLSFLCDTWPSPSYFFFPLLFFYLLLLPGKGKVKIKGSKYFYNSFLKLRSILHILRYSAEAVKVPLMRRGKEFRVLNNDGFILLVTFAILLREFHDNKIFTLHSLTQSPSQGYCLHFRNPWYPEQYMVHNVFLGQQASTIWLKKCSQPQAQNRPRNK